jgi:hypothetical protein
MGTKWNKYPLDRVGTEEARCHTCTIVKPLSAFADWQKGEISGYYSSCNLCRYQARVNRMNDLQHFLQDRIRTIRARAKNKGISFTISVSDLLYLYQSQNGCCFYTDTPLEIGRRNLKENFGKRPNVLSVDKVNCGLGYDLDNLVLCTNRVNTVKRDLTLEEIRQWLPGWYDRIQRRSSILERSNLTVGFNCVDTLPIEPTNTTTGPMRRATIDETVGTEFLLT